MKNFTRILVLCLTLFSVRATACELSNGKLSFQKVGDSYKIFLRQQPTNTCFNYDSIRFSVTLRCKMTGATENLNVGLHDTLTYDVDGVIILTGSIRWYFGGGNWIMRSFSPQCFGIGNGCFEKVPEISVPLPPSVLPEISIQNGLFSSNVGGVLVMVNMATYNVIVKEFPSAFQYQIPSGQWLVYLLLGDGTTIGQQVIEIP